MNSYASPEERLETFYNNKDFNKLINNKKYNIVRNSYETKPDDFVYEENCNTVIINNNTGNAFELKYSISNDSGPDGKDNYSEEYFELNFYTDISDNIEDYDQFSNTAKTLVNSDSYINKWFNRENIQQDFSGSEINYDQIVNYLDN
jgi:hypothetical protein